MFRIKICGIRSVQDAIAVADCGADALGLNFYRPSPRYVAPAVAREICAATRGRAALVGLFVNHPLGEVLATADLLELDYVQLHGDEPVEWLARLVPRKVIRGIRLHREDQVAEYLRGAAALNLAPAALLIDGFKQGDFGGTGTLADWEKFRKIQEVTTCPLVLAGGLTPENVREAIERTLCQAVDVASGVESEPGRKDLQRVRQFVSRAQAAFGAR